MRRLTLTLLIAIATLLSAEAKDKFITIEEIDGRSWLVNSEDEIIFPHGVNHIDAMKGLKLSPAEISKKIKALGFNAYGYGTPEKLYNDGMYYLESWNDLVPISTHLNPKAFHYRDVFAPAVIADIESKIEAKCRINRENKWLIGYLWTDLPAWSLKNKHKTNWVSFMRALPAKSAGKVAYIEYLKGIYNNIAAFNAVYKRSAQSWEALGEDIFEGMISTPKIQAEDRGFLKLIARQYYKVLGEATHRYDPNHIIFGDRFMPTMVEADLVSEMLPYVDAIAIQPNYKEGYPASSFEKIREMCDNKPILICDFAMRFEDGDREIRGGVLQPDEAAAGKAYADYIKAAFETNYILGSHWCNVVNLTEAKKAGTKQGLFYEDFTEREVLPKYIIELNKFLKNNTPKH